MQNEWTISKIGAVSKNIIPGATPSTSVKEFWDGNIRWMSSGEIHNRFVYDTKTKISQEGYDACSTTILPAHCVLVALAGQGKTRGCVAVNKVELCTNQSIAAIVPKDIYYLYLFFFLESKYSELRKISSGDGTRGGLNISLLNGFQLAIPTNSEQQKIAEILAGQDQVIALKEKLLAEKQKQKKYLMQQLLTGKKRLPGFSGEWKSNTVSEVCDNLDNYRKPFNRNERAVMKGIYPYYGANGIVDYIDKYIFDEEIILLAEDGGDFENYFEKPIAQRVMGKCWVNNHAHVLRVKQECSFDFVFYLLEHKDIRKYINGTTRSKLTKEDMQGIILNYPADKKEQTAIAEILSAADKEIELLKKDIEQEKLKKKSLMQLLLTGIVRVKA